MHHDSVPQTTQSLRRRQKGRKSLLLKQGHRVTFVSLLKQRKFTLKTVSFHLFEHLYKPSFHDEKNSIKTFLFLVKFLYFPRQIARYKSKHDMAALFGVIITF